MEELIDGWVLCQVGPNRLAFAAAHVGSIGGELGLDSQVISARAAFGMTPAPGRFLEEDGIGLLVDSVEISNQKAPLLPPPPILLGFAGGALEGFAALGDDLWPVMRISALARFVALGAAV